MDQAISYKVPRWKLIYVIKDLLYSKEETEDEKNQSKDNSPKKRTSYELNTSKGENARISLSPMLRVFELASGCVRNQRWTAAAKFFPAVARHVTASPLTVWKLGAACLAYHPDSNKTLMSSFANSMIQAGRNAAPEILMDHVIYLMCHAEFDEASRFIENYHKKCTKSHSESLMSNLQGTRGLLEYINWKTALRLRESVNEEMTDPLESISNEAKIMFHAEKAVNYLKSSFCCSGNYDVFVVKLIEVLEYYERLEEADEALTSYMQINQRHPTPYKIMFTFIQKHYPMDVQRQIYVLKELVSVSPCDYFVIKLSKLLPTEEIELKIRLLFDFVDYEEWRNNTEAWKCLSEVVLSKDVKTESCQKMLHSRIEDRRGWWVPYHFRLEDLHMQDAHLRELVVYKAVLVTVMFHSAHQFVKSVSEHLCGVSDEDNTGRLNDLLVKARQVGEDLKSFKLGQLINNLPSSQVKKVDLRFIQPPPINPQQQPINTQQPTAPFTNNYFHFKLQKPQNSVYKMVNNNFKQMVLNPSGTLVPVYAHNLQQQAATNSNNTVNLLQRIPNILRSPRQKTPPKATSTPKPPLPPVPRLPPPPPTSVLSSILTQKTPLQQLLMSSPAIFSLADRMECLTPAKINENSSVGPKKVTFSPGLVGKRKPDGSSDQSSAKKVKAVATKVPKTAVCRTYAAKKSVKMEEQTKLCEKSVKVVLERLSEKDIVRFTEEVKPDVWIVESDKKTVDVITVE